MSYTNYHIIHTIAAPYVKVINLEKTCSVKRIKACVFFKKKTNFFSPFLTWYCETIFRMDSVIHNHSCVRCGLF